MMIEIANSEIHIWTQSTDISSHQAMLLSSILSVEEESRAQQFHHIPAKQRFMMSRYYLRQIAALYLNKPPHAIKIAYSSHKKPFLCEENTDIQFNLSHSDQQIVFAFVQHHAVGIDIEKIKPIHCDKIVTRFFSQTEIADFIALPLDKKIAAFYCLWTRKEALLKAMGTGLHYPLDAFSVRPAPLHEAIYLANASWELIPLESDPGYTCSLATTLTAKKISYWTLTNNVPVLKKVYSMT
jgi:4'-phosphopantetheinyl transferase